MCTSVDRNALITMIMGILVTTIIITVIIIATTTINTNIIISITITNMRTTRIKRAVMITSWGTRRS